MVSFKELHEADFSGVTDAAEAWAGVAKALGSLEGRVGKELTSTPQRAGWKGAAADDAGRTLQGIDTDFKQAAGVATALSAIIRDAAEDFAAARKDLDNAIHDAESQQLTVAADGTVSWPPITGLPHNDPDSQEVQRKYQADMKGKAEGISTRLTKAVEKATAADQRATTALQTDIGTSTTSFNAHPLGGGDAADADRAKLLLAKAGSLSDEELKRLQDLMSANAGSKEFSTTLLNGLNVGGKTGPEALLEYSKVYGDLAHGNHNAKGYEDVYGSLSQVLATATKDGGMGKEWEDKLLKAARKPGGSAAGYNDNYPALTELMGARGTFDKSFLEKVGNDLVDYERNSKLKGEELWGPAYTAITGKQGDPMGGLMRAMSRNPEASKEFLDPGSNKNLDYLLKDRKWPNQGYEQNQIDAFARQSSRGAFGDALEAATTGRDPHGNQPPARPHDEAMARIMSETITTIGGDKPGNENNLPAGLRRPLGNMIADYAPDTYEILGKNTGGTSETSKLTIGRDQLIRTIRGVAEDPEAFRAIHYAESQEIARRLDGYPAEAFRPDSTGRPDHRIEGFTQEAGQVMGVLSGTRSDVVTDHRDDEIFKNNWRAKMDYHVIGTPLTAIPVAGDLVQRLVDVGTSEYANGLNADAELKASQELSKTFSSGYNQLDVMIRERAQIAGLSTDEINRTGGVTQNLLHQVDTSYHTGVNETYRMALGRS
ncbi:DUF6571 family protein [Kitasatospora sp. NPDC087315]|uniref:DUF6571 family protein n=1 Tax=Kitasatospora sp. NPDC087315 TaxID=3364069 RepID=UPI0037F40D45